MGVWNQVRREDGGRERLRRGFETRGWGGEARPLRGSEARPAWGLGVPDERPVLPPREEHLAVQVHGGPESPGP